MWGKSKTAKQNAIESYASYHFFFKDGIAWTFLVESTADMTVARRVANQGYQTFIVSVHAPIVAFWFIATPYHAIPWGSSTFPMCKPMHELNPRLFTVAIIPVWWTDPNTDRSALRTMFKEAVDPIGNIRTRGRRHRPGTHSAGSNQVELGQHRVT